MKNALTYKNYHGSVEFSADDQLFYGKILGIRDVVTFEGTSVDEINAAFKESVDDYIKTCKQYAKEPDKAFKGSFNVRVKPNIHRMISMKAQALRISLNQYVERVLENAVAAEYPEPEPKSPTIVQETPPADIVLHSRKKRQVLRRKK